ncbi:hypothetical protein FRC03_005714 [Tulasnella sp. 419]|nr:hypothetical protein FRC03_005714 [Tulasnella sp. 419]
MLTQATRSAIRCFSTSVVARKTVTDSVKETADTVNKKLGKGLASAIEGTEHAAQVTKETIGNDIHGSFIHVD